MKKKLLALAFVLLGIVGMAYGKSGVRTVTFVSGTEYQVGENGQTIVRVVNAFGQPVSANWCNVTIYYPDKTKFVDNQPMTQGGAPGSWYYTFVTPNQIGVYEQSVVCEVTTITGTRQIAAAKSFHVQQTLTLVNETSSAQIVIIS